MESNQDVFISQSITDSKLAYAMCDYLEIVPFLACIFI